MKIILALFVFGILIFVHELGHFLFAKLNHVTVVEFSLGMGPRLGSFQYGGTRYSIKLLPLGGSCMMQGEDMADTSEGSFGSKSPLARISIVAAGPIFNFLLAFVFSMFIVAGIGYDKPVLLGITENGPAEALGLEVGDEILAINGRSIHFYREISDYVTFHQDEMASGKEMHLTWRTKEGEKKSGTLISAESENGRRIIGIAGSHNNRVNASITEMPVIAACEVGYWIKLVFYSLRELLTGHVSANDVSGPVGVVEVIGETYEASKPDGAFYIWINLLNIATLLSANLGVMNLLPLPALDGGRLLFLLIELLRRKRLNPDVEGRIHFAGFALLMVLMVFIMANDFRRILF